MRVKNIFFIIFLVYICSKDPKEFEALVIKTKTIMRDSIKTYVKNIFLFQLFWLIIQNLSILRKKSFATFLFILQFYIFWYKMRHVAQLEVEKNLNICFANLWQIITHAIVGGDSSNQIFLCLNFFSNKGHSCQHFKKLKTKIII